MSTPKGKPPHPILAGSPSEGSLAADFVASLDPDESPLQWAEHLIALEAQHRVLTYIIFPDSDTSQTSRLVLFEEDASGILLTHITENGQTSVRLEPLQWRPDFTH